MDADDEDTTDELDDGNEGREDSAAETYIDLIGPLAVLTTRLVYSNKQIPIIRLVLMVVVGFGARIEWED